jgi:hypothetical protein
MDCISWYNDLASRGFPLQETLEFLDGLSKSDDIGSHFRICCMDAERPVSERKSGASLLFRDRGRTGVDYLMPLLDADDRTASHAAFLLASFPSLGPSLSSGEGAAVRRALARLAESDDAMVRRRSIIAIGWIGTEEEIPLLSRHLLTDEDAYCRAWSASSFLQMPDILRETIQTEAKGSLIACLESEQDAFVKGVAVEAVMAVWDVSFGLRSSAVEERNRRAVDRAARKALQFLKSEGRSSAMMRARTLGYPPGCLPTVVLYHV